MSNTLVPTVFTHPLFGEVRTVQINDELWFVAADIARILEHATAKDLARNIKKEYRGRQILPTSSGDQEMVVISTPGLFHALMNSRKAQAEPFQKWVLGDVLPGVARTGAAAVADQDSLLAAIETRLADEVGRLVGALLEFHRVAQAVGEELPPGADFGKNVTLLLSGMSLQLAHALSKDADLPLLRDGGRAYLQKVGLSAGQFFAEFTLGGRRYVGVAHPDECAPHLQRGIDAGERTGNRS